MSNDRQTGDAQKPFEAWIWTADAQADGAAVTRRFATLEAAKLWLTEMLAVDPSAAEYGIADESSGSREIVFMSRAIEERIKREVGDEALLCSECGENEVDVGDVCAGCAEHLGVDRGVIGGMGTRHEKEDDR